MTTATKTTLPRRSLPVLNVDPVPVALEAMGGEGAELAKRRKAAMREAHHLRAASDDAARAVEAAAEQDVEAFRQAALEEKPDPGRRHEIKAQAAAEKAFREAEGATLKSNALAVHVTNAITGEPGAEALTALDGRMSKAQERLREHLEPVEEDLAELAAIAAAIEQIEKARKPNRRGMPQPRSGALPSIHVNGGPHAPAHLIELIKAHEPRRPA